MVRHAPLVCGFPAVHGFVAGAVHPLAVAVAPPASQAQLLVLQRLSLAWVVHAEASPVAAQPLPAGPDAPPSHTQPVKPLHAASVTEVVQFEPPVHVVAPASQ